MQEQVLKSGEPLKTASDLSPRRQTAIDRIYEHDRTLLIAPTGAGKTVITLTAIDELLKNKQLKKVLVVAPAKVVPNWAREQDSWGHINLRVAGCTGIVAVTQMLTQSLDVLVTSYESLPLVLKAKHGCDGIVLDEITRMKASGGKVFKKLRHKIKQFNWRVGMSAPRS